MEVQRSLAVSGFFLGTLDSTLNPRKELLEFVTAFSKPHAWTRDGSERVPIVVDIRPIEGQDPHSYQGSREFSLHTDSCWLKRPPRYAALLCLEPEEEGGGDSLLVDGYQALVSLSRADIDEIAANPCLFLSHRDAASESSYQAPILTRSAPYQIRFRRDLMSGALGGAAKKFLKVAETLVRRFRLERGNVLVVDNFRMLHGRESLRAGLSSKRHLLRVHTK